MLQADWRPLLCAVIYVVQFQADPLHAIDHVFAQVIEPGALGATREAYRDALAQALASDDALATLIPQPHSEATIRQFIAQLFHRLQE
jgi:hypothetical protein